MQVAELIVHGWNSQCGVCKYGGTSWADSPKGPILTPDSRECPECKVIFTHVRTLPGYPQETVEEIK
jgi:hypothetical protein